MNEADVDVFVGNYTIVDREIFQLWLDGFTVREAANKLDKKEDYAAFNVTFDVVLSDIKDHYRNFNMLEKLLYTPTRLSEQLKFQIEPELQTLLIEKYYEITPAVVRDILGKKLTSKHLRKDLENVSEKTKVPQKSCKRQFDNAKRVFKTVEEMKGSLVENIKTHYLLSDDLARQYAVIVFLANNKLETSKKKLQYLTFHDFVVCSDILITYWSYSSVDSAEQDMDVDFDRFFLHDLRKLSGINDRDVIEEHKSAVCRHLKGKLSERACADLDTRFSKITHALVNIATGLIHSKEARDFFLDIVEKIIEPCKEKGWQKPDIDEFLTAYCDTSSDIDFFRGSPTLFKLWERYMVPVKQCILQMYHS